MDVVLQTNDRDKSLGLFSVRRFADNSGYCVDLRVLSHGFTVDMPFCFEPPRLTEFIEQLERMNQTLTGEACLKPTYETNYFRLAMGHTGAVIVTGELWTLHDGEDHRIRFGFRTDQTCLSPLIGDLRSCLGMATV